MYNIKSYIEKNKILIVIISIIFILFLIALFFIFDNKKTEEIIINDIYQKEEPNENIKTIEEVKLKVDIKGRVEKPGVYELDQNSRVIDVITKAGGLKKDANTDYINLSKKIIDEMIIIIYSNDEVNKFKKEDKQVIYIKYECECPDNINDACIDKDDTVNTNDVAVKDDKLEEEEKDLISINTADKDLLMELPGIGESKADSIIEYRNKNGEFKSLEDIKNVSGIGDSAYSKIKDYIKL